MAKCYNCHEEAELMIAEDIPVCAACEVAADALRVERHTRGNIGQQQRLEPVKAGPQSEDATLWYSARSA